MKLPAESGFTAVATLLAASAIGGGFIMGRYFDAPQVRTVHRTVVRSPYGKPDQSIDGAQVNSQLAGLTCDVYQAKSAVVCHP